MEEPNQCERCKKIFAFPCRLVRHQNSKIKCAVVRIRPPQVTEPLAAAPVIQTSENLQQTIKDLITCLDSKLIASTSIINNNTINITQNNTNILGITAFDQGNLKNLLDDPSIRQVLQDCMTQRPRDMPIAIRDINWFITKANSSIYYDPKTGKTHVFDGKAWVEKDTVKVTRLCCEQTSYLSTDFIKINTASRRYHGLDPPVAEVQKLCGEIENDWDCKDNIDGMFAFISRPDNVDKGMINFAYQHHFNKIWEKDAVKGIKSTS